MTEENSEFIGSELATGKIPIYMIQLEDTDNNTIKNLNPEGYKTTTTLANGERIYVFITDIPQNYTFGSDSSDLVTPDQERDRNPYGGKPEGTSPLVSEHDNKWENPYRTTTGQENIQYLLDKDTKNMGKSKEEENIVLEMRNKGKRQNKGKGTGKHPRSKGRAGRATGKQQKNNRKKSRR